MITGGLGSLGRLMTQWLAAQAEPGVCASSQPERSAAPLHVVLGARTAHTAAAELLLGSVAHRRHVSVCIHQGDAACSGDAAALLSAAGMVRFWQPPMLRLALTSRQA